MKDSKITIITSIHPDFDKRVWRHAKLTSKIGFKVSLICPWKVPRGEVRNNVELIPFRKISNRIARLIILPFIILGEIIKTFRSTDLYHFHDLDLLPLMTLVSFFKPVVYDIHENYADEMLDREWIPRLLRRPLYLTVKYGQWLLTRKVKNLVCVVPSQELELRGKLVNSVIIRNFASLELAVRNRPRYDERDNVVIYTGGHYKSNGSELLLDTIEELCLKRGLKVTFLLSSKFTSSGYKRFFLEQITERRLEEYVEFFPQVTLDELTQFMDKAKVGISPNLNVSKQRKALPTKIFEYMASGLPSVATDLPLIRETCANVELGLFVSDDAVSMSNALECILFTEPWSQERSDNLVQAFKEHLSWESQGNVLHQFYKRILE